MREPRTCSPRPLGTTSFPVNAPPPRHRWLAIVLAATGLLGCGRTLAAAPTPLSWFAGNWHCAGKFEASGKPIEARLRFDWNEAARALVKHHDDQPPNPYHAVELWGSGQAGLTAVIADAYSGTRMFTSPGWADESLSWTRTADGRPVERFTYVREAPDRLGIEWATSRDGATFKIGDTLSCERQRPD